ncbi:hypothetical protein AB7M69_003909 [Bradyrhizobium japonicum]
MTGRLEAPGAKLEPVMPGLENSRSPSWPPPSRRISSFGTTVTVANWLVTIGSTPCWGAAAVAGAVGAASAVRCWLRDRPVRATWTGLRVGTTLRTIGLGAVTVTAGISVDDLSCAGCCTGSWASADVAAAPSRSRLAPPRRCARRNSNDMVLIPVRRRPQDLVLIGGGLPSQRDGIRLQLLPCVRLKAASPGVIK